MKFMEKLQKRQKDNKGFSLVELIIVIAIMAILVGIVGAQVVPYLNRSKVAKDQQILSSFLTDGVSAFSMNAEKVTSGNTIVLTITPASKTATVGGTADAAVIATYEELNGVTTSGGSFPVSLSSKDGAKITTVTITYGDSGVTLSASGTGLTDNADLYIGSGKELKSSK